MLKNLLKINLLNNKLIYFSILSFVDLIIFYYVENFLFVEYKLVDKRDNSKWWIQKTRFLKEEITKIRETIFWNTLEFLSSQFFLTLASSHKFSQVLPCEEVGFSIYKWWSRTWVHLESLFLKKFWNPSHIETARALVNEVCRRR